MKIICKNKTIMRKALDNPEKFEPFDYDLDIGVKYTIYSMKLWNGQIKYLLADDYGNSPHWYPAELFDIVDHLYPLEWYYTFRGYEKDELQAVWGYKEMVINVEEHYEALIDLLPQALEIFFKRKKEIDEDEELNKFRLKK